MDAKKILMFLGLIFSLYIFLRLLSLSFVRVVPVTTSTTTTSVVRPVSRDVHVVSPVVGNYNPYKSQYYNSVL